MAWRAAYVDRLAGPGGWWATSGLTWLPLGTTLIGNGEHCDVKLRSEGAHAAARIHWNGQTVTVEPLTTEGVHTGGEPLREPVTVEQTDRTFTLGRHEDAVRFVILVRGSRRAVRTFDPALTVTRNPESDVAWYPIEPGWVVPATLTPAGEGETVPIVSMQGDVRDVPAAGRLHARVQGHDVTLLATKAGENLFVNLRDAGSGAASYGAGRFLTVPAPEGGATTLDFHRLHHPPCAHTPFATCPLPPLENRLRFVVAAGERTPETTRERSG